MLNNNLSILDILTILSFFIGIENLQMNIEQNQALDKHLQQQDDILLKQQNKMLEIIIGQNNELLKKLGGNNESH